MQTLYADNHIVVVNKPSGLLSVPGRGPENQDCVMNRVKEEFPQSIPNPTVHRLDMDTSGILVMGITAQAQRALSIQFQDRKTEKHYVALLEGHLDATSGRIDLPHRVDFFNRPYQMYDPIHGKLGTTFWRTITEEGPYSRVEFTPITGRTHQLRFHAAHTLGLHTPIVGDVLYGKGTASGQLKLHAAYLRFTHPETNTTMEFIQPPAF